MSTQLRKHRRAGDLLLAGLKPLAGLALILALGSLFDLRQPSRMAEDLPLATQGGGQATAQAALEQSSSDRSFAQADVSPADHPVPPNPGTQENKPEENGNLEATRRAEAVRTWAETDVLAAAAWAEHLPDGTERREALEQIAIAWANTDLAGAARWFGSLPEDTSRAAAGLALGYESARTDPLTALDILGKLAPSPERDEALAHSMSQWAGEDFDAAKGWAMNVEDPILKSKLLVAAAVAVAESDGAAAADLAARCLASPEDQGRAAVAIVQRWAQTAPEAAADWVGRFSESPIRTAAIENLYSIWAAGDETAAEAYLSGLPPGPLRQTASAAIQRTVIR